MKRRLKIEATGDFWAGKVKPRIRLAGYWLERAGFPPGGSVEIGETAPGVLTLRAQAPEGETPSPAVPKSPRFCPVEKPNVSGPSDGQSAPYQKQMFLERL